MFLRNLLCCNSCNVENTTEHFPSSQSSSIVETNKIINNTSNYDTTIRMGEIINLKRAKKVPSLEVIVEREEGRIDSSL